MKWLKDKIQQYRQYKAKKEAQEIEAERVRLTQKAKQRAFDSELLKWRVARSKELREEILAGWRSARNTDIKEKFKTAQAEFLSWVDVVSEEGEIKLESLRDLGNGVIALESRSGKKIDTELDDQIRERLNLEEAIIKNRNRVTEIERLRPKFGDTWANNQLYMLHPGLCPMPDRVKIRRSIRKQRQKDEDRAFAIESVLSLVVGILLLPVIFILWGTWKWNR